MVVFASTEALHDSRSQSPVHFEIRKYISNLQGIIKHLRSLLLPAHQCSCAGSRFAVYASRLDYCQTIVRLYKANSMKCCENKIPTRIRRMNKQTICNQVCKASHRLWFCGNQPTGRWWSKRDFDVPNMQPALEHLFASTVQVPKSCTDLELMRLPSLHFGSWNSQQMDFKFVRKNRN